MADQFVLTRTELEPDLAYELRLAAPPEEVFRHWADPARIVTWMGAVATLDPTPGGAFRLEYRSGQVAEGSYVAVEPPHRLAFTWGWAGEADFPPGSSTIDLAFEAIADHATLLRLRHLGIPPELRANVDEGWGYFLPRLAAALAASTRA